MDYQTLCLANEGSALDSKVINSLAGAEIQQCIEFEDAGNQFLRACFFYHKDLPDSLRASVLNHVNCPDDVLLFGLKFYPHIDCSVAVSLRQLNEMTCGAEEKGWKDRVAEYQKREVYYNLRDIKFIKAQIGKPYKSVYFSDRSYPSSTVCNFSNSVLDAILKIGKAKDIEVIRYNGDKSVHAFLAAHSNFRCRVSVATYDNVADNIIVMLAKDEKLSVRKAIAKRRKLPAEAVAVLANDDSAEIKSLLSKNKSVSSEQRKSLAASKLEQLTGPTTADTVRNSLDLCSERSLEEQDLLALANHPEPIVRCASGFHKHAHTQIHDILINDPVEWVRSSVAGRSANPEYLTMLADSNDLDVLRHLATNRTLGEDLSHKLLLASDDNQVRLGIAANQVDNPQIVEAIVQTQRSDSEWELALVQAIDPRTKATTLRNLYYESRELCVSRAVARHLNCPKNLVKIFAQYLRKDILANPKVAMSLLENEKITAHQFSDWSVVDRLNDGSAHAFIANKATRRRDLKFSRPAVSCEFIQTPFLDYAVLRNDMATNKRLLQRDPESLSRFVTEILSHGGPTIRKAVAGMATIDQSIIARLCKDKDKSVSLAACHTAKGSGFNITVADQAITSGKRQSLGNKAARMELAIITRENEILSRLSEDKLSPVRVAVIGSKYLSTDLLLNLCEDIDGDVAFEALNKFRRGKITNEQEVKYQGILSAALVDSSKDRRIRRLALRQSADVTAIENAFMTGKLEGYEGEVAGRVQTAAVVDAMIQLASSGVIRRHHWLAELAACENLTSIQLDSIVSLLGKDSPILHRVTSAELYISIFTTHDWSWVNDIQSGSPSAAKFSAAQINQLLDHDPRALIILGEQAASLPAGRVIKMLSTFQSGEIETTLRSIPWEHSAIRSWLFDWCQKNEKPDREYEDGLLEQYMSYQKPTAEQISICIDHADDEVRAALANNVNIGGEILMKLASDKKAGVREALLYRETEEAYALMEGSDEEVYGSDLPEDVLLILAADKDREIKDMARGELKRRNIPLTKIRSNETTPITHLLKKHDAPFGAAKANKKLIELGVLEMAQRESTSKPGEFRKFKLLSNEGKIWGVNKFNEYGDATPEYFDERFPELLKKIA